jgi:hypothetical protein
MGTCLSRSPSSLSHLGVPAMKLLHDLSDKAASPQTSSICASFEAGTLRELGVGLCHGNCAMYQASAGILARVTGGSFRTSMVSLSDEVV